MFYIGIAIGIAIGVLGYLGYDKYFAKAEATAKEIGADLKKF